MVAPFLVVAASLVGANEPPPPPPPLAPVALTTAEDTPLTTTLAVTDGATLKLRKAPRKGNATLDGANLTYTPNKDFNGDDDVIIEITIDGRRHEQKLPVTVTPVNDLPVVEPLVLGTKEEVATGARLTAKDVDGDTLRFSIEQQPEAGTATVDGKGNVVFTPKKDVVGEASFDVVVDDGNGGIVKAPVTVKIANVNDAPAAEALKLSGDEDTAITGAIVASDVDGDALTMSIGQSPKNGTASTTTKGQVEYRPKANWHGTDRFTVVVKDSAGATATATVDVVVAPVNDPPTARAASATTAEDTAVDVVVEASDVDGDALSFAVEPVADGTAAIDNKGKLRFTPKKDFNGKVDLVVVVSDGKGASTQAPVSIRVTPVNDPPQATNTALSTDEDVVGSVTVVDSDVDGDTLTYSIGTAPKRGTATIDNRGTLTFSPAKDAHGTDSVVVVVTDAAGATASATVSITIAPVNDHPVAAPVKGTTREDTAVTVTVVATDVDGDALRYEIPTAPKSGTASIDGKGVVTYTPPRDHVSAANSDELIEVVVDDSKGGRITVPVRIVVTPVNDKPVVSAIPLSTPEDTALTVQLGETASDVDGDTLRFVLFTPPKNGRATLSKTGELRYTPPRDWHGKDTFTVEVDDGQAFARADFTIVVEPVNDAPVTQPLSLSSDEDRPVKGTLRASDVDGDKLRWSVRDQPQHGEAVVDADRGRVTFTPAKDWHGKDAFVVVANDGTTETPANVDVVVAPVPDPPDVFAATLQVSEDTVAEGTLPAREPDGERLTFVLVGEPKLGSVVLLDKNSGRIRYTPRPDVNGTDRIGFTATDNITVVNGVFDVVVAAVNDAPIAEGASATTTEDTPVEVTVAMRDVDDDALAVTVVGTVDGGRVEVVDAKKGRLRVHPTADKHGSVKFQVAATETSTKPPLSSKPVPVEVKVDPKNDPPVIVAARFSTPEDTQLKGSLKASDVDGDVLAFRAGRAPTRGVVEVDKKSGAFVYTPHENMFGPDSFTVVARDPAGLEATGVVSIDVVAVDDPPIALDVRLRSPRAGRITGQLVGRDPEGAPLRFVITSKPSIGRVQLLDEKTGAFAYYAEGGERRGETSFTFVIEAGSERSLPATVRIEVP